MKIRNRFVEIMKEGNYRLTTVAQVRKEFWDTVEERGLMLPGVSRKKIANYSGNGTMHNTDTRTAFVDFVDQLSKNGDISQELAQNVTL